MADLPDADSGIGEEVADARRVLSLCLNETMVAPAMTGMSERGGEKLVLPGLGFEAQPLFPQCAIETDANFVGFALKLRSCHGVRGNSSWKLRFFSSLPMLSISSDGAQITGRASGNPSKRTARLPLVVTQPPSSQADIFPLSRSATYCPHPILMNPSIGIKHCPSSSQSVLIPAGFNSAG
jgi:hypothetical protein